MAAVAAFMTELTVVANLGREETIASWRAVKAALDSQPCDTAGWDTLLGRKMALDSRLMVWGIYEPAMTISMD